MSIGHRIRTLRKKNRLKQDDLAKQANVSRVSIGFYERDERMPPIDIAGRIASVLSVTTDYLLNGNTKEMIKRAGEVFGDNDMPTEGEWAAQQQEFKAELDTDFNMLNYTGKKTAAERVHELTLIEDYTKQD